jgi:hypothetical protein
VQQAGRAYEWVRLDTPPRPLPRSKSTADQLPAPCQLPSGSKTLLLIGSQAPFPLFVQQFLDVICSPDGVFVVPESKSW